MSRIALDFYKVVGLPADPEADSQYYAFDDVNGIAVVWVTNEDGVPYPLNMPITPRLLSTTVIDLNQGSAVKQALYTVPANRRLITTALHIDKLSAVPSNAEFTVGLNGTADDMLSAFHLADLISDDSAYGSLLAAPGSLLVGAAGQTLGLKQTTAEGSALTGRINHFGYLTDVNGVPVLF